jgi:DNA-binding LytR/AlgR family response regulator
MEAAVAMDEQQFIIVKSAKRWIKLDFEEIDYFNSIGDYVKIHTRGGGMVLANETMKKIEEVLPGMHFVRVHKSYIVSIRSIRYIEGNHLAIGEERIPIGLTYREELIRRFNIQL